MVLVVKKVCARKSIATTTPNSIDNGRYVQAFAPVRLIASCSSYP